MYEDDDDDMPFGAEGGDQEAEEEDNEEISSEQWQVCSMVYLCEKANKSSFWYNKDSPISTL